MINIKLIRIKITYNYHPPSPLLLLEIADPICINCESRLGLSQIGRVVHLAYSGLATALPQEQASRRRVSHYVSPNRFLSVLCVHRTRIHRCHHLVRNYHRHPELVGQLLQTPHELAQVRLPVEQFAATREIRAIQGSGTVHNHQREPRLGQHSAGLRQQRHLVVRVVRAGITNIVQHVLTIQLVPAADAEHAIRAKGALRVDEQALAFTAVAADLEMNDKDKSFVILQWFTDPFVF